MSQERKRSAKSISRRNFLLTTAAAGIGVSAPWIWTKQKGVAQVTVTVPTILDPRFSAPVLDPTKIPKFADPLPVPEIDYSLPKPVTTWPVLNAGSEPIRIVERSVNILPQATGLPTTVWCYRGNSDYSSTFLGPTMVAYSSLAPTNGAASVVTYDYSQLKDSSSNTPTIHLLRRGGVNSAECD